jgi:hypothetical protein
VIHDLVSVELPACSSSHETGALQEKMIFFSFLAVATLEGN